MADLVITPANVTISSGTPDSKKRAGETLLAGQLVYLKADDKLWLAQCDGTDAEVTLYGVTTNPALANQTVSVLKTEGDVLALGAIVTVGTIYVPSRTAGGIAPQADLLATDKISYFGYGITTSTIKLLLKNTGLTKA